MGMSYAADAPVLADGQKAAETQLQAASEALEEVRKSLDDSDSAETLQTLSERALQSRRDADSTATALEPLLKQLDARIEQLGTLEDGAKESEEIAQQRKDLDKQRSELDADIKRAKLLSVEALQTSEAIEKMRTQQFSDEISTKVASPLSPSLWKQFAQLLPGDLRRLQALFQQGSNTFINAVQERGWAPLLNGLIMALILLFPLRLGLRAVGRRFAMSKRAPDGRLRRSGLALWSLLVGTILPGLANWVFIESLRSIDAIAPRLQLVADAWVKSSFVAAFFLSLSACLLVPKRPSWRLLDIDNQAAPALQRIAWGAAALTWFAMMLNAIDVAARTSAVSTVAVDGIIALTYVGLISTTLLTLNRQRQRQLQQATNQPQHEGKQQINRRGSWLMAAWLGGHVTVLGALIATLLGYLNFAVFLSTQMVWITVVVLATSLLLKFFDDLCSWLCAPGSRPGKAMHHITGLSSSSIEQIGVLLSAILRVCSLLLGLSALMAPFGNIGSMLGWTGSVQGIPIGEAILRPSAILRALLVLGIGLTVFRIFQRWLTDTYLPKTELDIGARNSISTVARYVGIILSVLWTLAALGIGLEKIALLASALSVGIGFGLQAITQNFVSGLILLAERPVRLGDRVRIGDQVGDIRRISVRATEIQTDDKATLIVPNSELITKAVQNLTRDGTLGRISIAFSVPLDTNVVELRTLLLDIYNSHESVLENPAPAMYVDGINGGNIQIASSGYVSSPRNVYSTRSDLLFALLQRMHEEGIALTSATSIQLVPSPLDALQADILANAPAAHGMAAAEAAPLAADGSVHGAPDTPAAASPASTTPPVPPASKK